MVGGINIFLRRCRGVRWKWVGGFEVGRMEVDGMGYADGRKDVGM